MIKETIKKTIITHDLIHNGEHIVIGLSGGPDSVCLFHVLKELRREMCVSLYAVHVNHKLRPGEAEADQAYVEELCQKEQIPCTCFVYDCRTMAAEQGLSSEAAGRKARYEAFGKFCVQLVQKGIPKEQIKIAVAQNADDQAETVLLRLLRGSGPDGLAGMPYIRTQGPFSVIRPLLDTARKDIEAYCESQGLKPRIDQTNLQPIYTRNKVRLELLPYLREQFNPNITEALLRLSKTAGEDKAYLWQMTEQALAGITADDGSLDLEGLKALPAPIRHRAVMKAFEYAGLTQDLTSAHLEAADGLLAGGKPSGTIHVAGGYQMEIQYEKVLFYKKSAAAKKQKEAAFPFHLEHRIIDPPAAYPKDGALFDWDKIKARHGDRQPVLRTRNPGDYISLKTGRKKLQDFFVDQKVPREQRDDIPLVAMGSEILWIVAPDSGSVSHHRYSEKYKLDQATKKALLLEIVCEI